MGGGTVAAQFLREGAAAPIAETLKRSVVRKLRGTVTVHPETHITYAPLYFVEIQPTDGQAPKTYFGNVWAGRKRTPGNPERPAPGNGIRLDKPIPLHLNMKLLALCNDRLALPALSQLLQAGVLAGVGMSARESGTHSVVKTLCANHRVPVRYFRKEGFATERKLGYAKRRRRPCS